MKFKRNAKLFPTVKLNLRKSGIDISLGSKRMSLASGFKGKRIKQAHTPFHPTYVYHIPNYHKVEIKTKNVDKITSSTLEELQTMIEYCFRKRKSIKAEIEILQTEIPHALFLNRLSKVFIVGFFIKWFDRNLSQKKNI
ncbi:MAG: DUF4236 domain-containing protein [Tannerellaceae bacterium]|nr:DUF4236 domain-containing protein [Tannerellaceae bacterium]